ncbi:MAG: ATP-binding protein [Bryobacteraceae bacterium]
MRWIARDIQATVVAAARHFPSVVLTGARRTGKTSLLRRLFPQAQYVLLEDPDLQMRVRSDPREFLDELTSPVLVDEIQHAPELLAYVRARIDANPRRMGQWLFTGSQETPLMRGVTESMAGRAAILQLSGLSLAESSRVSMLSGGFPEAVARPKARGLWFSSYIQTYLERDVRTVTNVRDLVTFRRFLALLASRHGQILNRTDFAAGLGVSLPTVSEWLDVLEVTGQILRVPPYFENFGKRLLKSPKVYLADSGMACYLLGIQSQAELGRSPFLGTIFEGMIAAEVLKSQANAGRRREIYYFRDQQGLEVDFLVPAPNGGVLLLECKAARTVSPGMASGMAALRKAMASPNVQMFLVHRPQTGDPATRALAPGVRAVDATALDAVLKGR